MSLAFWICSGVTAISAGVSFSYAVSGLRSADPSSRTASMYALSRSFALLAVAVVAPFLGVAPFVAAIAIAMIIVHTADAVIGAVNGVRLKAFGPAGTAVINLGALVWLLLA